MQTVHTYHATIHKETMLRIKSILILTLMFDKLQAMTCVVNQQSSGSILHTQ